MGNCISKLFGTSATTSELQQPLLHPQVQQLRNCDSFQTAHSPPATQFMSTASNNSFNYRSAAGTPSPVDELTSFLETNQLIHKLQTLKDEGYDVTSLATLTETELNKLGFAKADQTKLSKGLVRHFLRLSDLGQYSNILDGHSMMDLAKLSLEDLEKLGVKPKGHRVRILLSLTPLRVYQMSTAPAPVLVTPTTTTTTTTTTTNVVPQAETSSAPAPAKAAAPIMTTVSWETLTGAWFSDDNTFAVRILNNHLYDTQMQSFYGPATLDGKKITSFKAAIASDSWDSFTATVEGDKLHVVLKEKDKGAPVKYILEKKTPPYPLTYWATYYTRDTACGMLVGASMLGAEKRVEALLATIEKEPKLAKVINTRKEVWSKEAALQRQMKNIPHPFPDDYVPDEEEESETDPTLEDLIGTWVDNQSNNNVWEFTKTLRMTSISFIFTPVKLNGKQISVEYVELSNNDVYYQVTGTVINPTAMKLKITSHLQVEDDVSDDDKFVSETKEILMKKGSSMYPTYCVIDNMQASGYSWSLISACSNGAVKSVEALLSNKPADFDINARREDADGNTIFYSFANMHHKNTANIIDVTRMLLAHGADYKVYGTKGSILHAACQLNCHRLVKILLELGCDPNEWYSDKPVSPLWQACQRGHDELVEILAEAGADILVECEGQKALYNISGGSVGVRMAELLMKRGNDINVPLDKDLNTILHRAVDKKDATLIEGLLALGANPDVVNKRGYTPRSNAGTRDIKKLFIHPDFYTIIDHIAKGEHKALEEILKRNKDDSKRPDAENATDPMGWSILMFSAILAQWKCVEVILNFNPELNYRNEFQLNAALCAQVTGIKTPLSNEGKEALKKLSHNQNEMLKIIEEVYSKSDKDGQILLTWGQDAIPLITGRQSGSSRNGRGAGLQNRMEDGIPDVVELPATSGADAHSDFYPAGYKPPSLWDFLINLKEADIPNSFADKSQLLIDSKLFVLGRVANKVQGTPRDICVLYLYTVECDIYKLCNRAMRMLDSQGLTTWRPFIYYLVNALNVLPPSRNVVYRGIGIPFDVNLYSPGKRVTWLAFSSTSAAQSVATSFLSCSKGIVFVIQARSGKLIELYSQFPGEKEVLFSAKSQFVVNGLYRTKDYNLMGKAISPNEANNYDKVIITMTEVDPQ